MMAGSVAGLSLTPPGRPNPVQINAEMTGSSNVRPGNYTVFFDGSVAVGARFDMANTRAGIAAEIGNVTVTATNGIVQVGPFWVGVGGP
jgi:hypothetical protein